MYCDACLACIQTFVENIMTSTSQGGEKNSETCIRRETPQSILIRMSDWISQGIDLPALMELPRGVGGGGGGGCRLTKQIGKSRLMLTDASRWWKQIH